MIVCETSGAVSSVFNGRPVPDDRFKQPFIVEFIFCFTTHIVGDLGDRHLLLPRQSEVNGDPFDGNDAPATAETDLLGTDLQSLDAAAYQFAVAFIPRSLILGRKKKWKRVCIQPAPGCRSGCL